MPEILSFSDILIFSLFVKISNRKRVVEKLEMALFKIRATMVSQEDGSRPIPT